MTPLEIQRIAMAILAELDRQARESLASPYVAMDAEEDLADVALDGRFDLYAVAVVVALMLSPGVR